MGIIKDNRPRDWAYRVAFDRKDLPSLQEMIKHIQETHDVDMIERFNSNCDQFLQGDNPEFPTPQPISVSKTDDLVVNVGLQQCINIILGTSALRWIDIALAGGGANIAPAVTDTDLDNTGGGIFYLPLAIYGWSEAKGMKLFFGAVGPQDPITPLGTGSIGDMGVSNGANLPTGALLNRERFFNNRLTRTKTPDLQVYASVFLFSCVVEFCPVA